MSIIIEELNNRNPGRRPSEPLVEGRREIAITITVDPKRFFGDTRYPLLDPMEQRQFLIQKITELRVEMENRGLHWYRNVMHFENHNSGMVHVHGTIEISDIYYPYQSILKTISVIMSKLVGRKNKNSKISCTTKWIEDREGWEKYLHKAQGDPLLAPIVIRNPREKTIIEWLTSKIT